MGTTVTIIGNVFVEDFKYLQNATDLTILQSGPFWAGELEPFWNNAKRSDLVIIALFGNDLGDFLVKHEQNPIIQNLFLSRSIKKVVWTFDCHHQTLSERRCQPLFDRFYLAHSPYLPAYDQERVAWLPTSYCHFGIDYLREHAHNSYPIERTAILPCKPYDIGDRDYLIGKIGNILKRRGISAHIGPFDSNIEYMNALLRTQLCINISLYDDLNIRNFDTWACNRVLLTNKVPDHDLIKFDGSHTYYYDRDLTDFEAALDRALADSATNFKTYHEVLNQHTITHRYIQMINRELGTNISIQNLN